MRRAARTDGNQEAIVSALRAAGCSVTVTSGAGNGFPDLAVGIERANILIEVKDPSKPASDRCFTPAQKKWHREWQGTAHVVETVDQALAIAAFYRTGKVAA